MERRERAEDTARLAALTPDERDAEREWRTPRATWLPGPPIEHYGEAHTTRLARMLQGFDFDAGQWVGGKGLIPFEHEIERYIREHTTKRRDP